MTGLQMEMTRVPPTSMTMSITWTMMTMGILRVHLMMKLTILLTEKMMAMSKLPKMVRLKSQNPPRRTRTTTVTKLKMIDKSPI